MAAVMVSEESGGIDGDRNDGEARREMVVMWLWRCEGSHDDGGCGEGKVRVMMIPDCCDR